MLAGWGFDGYRATDGGQISQAVSLHKFVPTLDQAIGFAAAAQSDIADGDDYARGLLHAFLTGNVSLPQARTLLRNTLRVRFRLGLFEQPPPYAQFGEGDVGAPSAWAAAALASREGLVLLANAGAPRALPLQPGAPWARAGALAVIGPNANSTLTLQGNYGGAFCAGGRGATDCFPSIFTALRAHAPGATWSPGCRTAAASDPAALAAAVAAARGADAAVLVLGLDQSLEREQLDRYNISLPAAQQALFDAVADAVAGTRTKLVVVLVHGGMLAAPAIAARADAVLDALYPGVRGGEAVADALFGVFSPGGKMPYTTYAPAYAAMYNFTNMSIAAPQAYVAADGSARVTPGGRTYRYYAGGDELWPCFWGLSYTNFSLSWATPQPPAPLTLTPAAPNATLTVVLENVGARDGDEVVLLFAVPVAGTFGARPPPFLPARSLVGFARRSLAAGGRATLAFQVAAEDALALTQADGSRAPINGGAFSLAVGTGPAQPAVALSVEVRLQGWP